MILVTYSMEEAELLCDTISCLLMLILNVLVMRKIKNNLFLLL